MELPPESMFDEMSLQHGECSNYSCGFKGVAIYEESRRGSMDRERYHHFGYGISEESFALLRDKMTSCPEPRNAQCQCKTHQFLSWDDGKEYRDLTSNPIFKWS